MAFTRLRWRKLCSTQSLAFITTLSVIFFLIQVLFMNAEYQERETIFKAVDVVDNTSIIGEHWQKLRRLSKVYLAEKRLPDAAIIGVARGGTAALHSFLSMNPYIRVPESHDIKFFHHNFHLGLSWYQGEMPYALPNQVILDLDPYSFDFDHVAKKMADVDKNMKLIIVLRDPVERLITDLHMYKDTPIKDVLFTKSGEVDDKFWFVRRSLYRIRLASWFHFFKREQILILETKDFTTNPIKVLNSIETFLGVPIVITKRNVVYLEEKGFYCKKPNNRTFCINAVVSGDNNGLIDKKEMDKLHTFFRQEDPKLSKLMNRTFSWQKSPS